MPELTKQDLESLLRPKLGKNLMVESFTSKPLTQPGENYGSTMLAIEVVVNLRDKAARQNLSLVAKLVPPSEMQWKIFNPPTTFCNEINCYLLIKEEHKKLQIEKNVPKDKFVEVFPKCYGARTTLAEEIGDKADKNAALLLENLKIANYRSVDRRVGLNLDHTQLVLSRLAWFHGLSIALKILKPQVFKELVLKACKPYNMYFDEEEIPGRVLKLVNTVKAIPGCEIYADRIKKASELAAKIYLDTSLLPTKEPYATISHLDFWGNNIMFRYESDNDNSPTDVKFVDFQGVRYTSPVKDLIFFLYSSTAEGVRAKHYDDLIHLYYENFTDCLKSVGCDTTPFSFQSLLDEIDEFAPTEAEHILFMLIVINVTGLSQGNMEEIFEMTNNAMFQRKAKEFILDFVKRGWL